MSLPSPSSAEPARPPVSTPVERLDRRRFVTGLGGAMAAALLPRLPRAWAAPPAGPGGEVFTLGVASGDPRPDRVVLWTRLAAEPLAGGGMPPAPVPVYWEVATDDDFAHVVEHGVALADPKHAHSVHVDVGGLDPARWYWYRFATKDETSPVGRTRTAPARDASPSHLRFAFASCQQYEHGFYTAYRHMAKEDLHLVVHLGDYIYEHATGVYVAPGGNVRHHVGPETTTLEGYRQRHAQYKSDPDLQAAHAAFPFVVTWDDHEVDNNYAGDVAEDGTPPAVFRSRRAAAYQAYWEHMPLSPAQAPRGGALQLYRRLRLGRLAELNVLDTRQYRSDQPCGDRTSDCPGRTAPTQTITGSRQERWLLDGLDRSPVRWNIIAQQVFMAQIDRVAGPRRGFYVDGWDGYVASRDRLMNFLADRRPSNPVVLTGDWHTNWVADLKARFDDPDSTTLGTEFVGTSVTSGGDGSDTAAYARTVLAENGHLHFFNNQRGYVRCDVTPGRWQTDFRVVPFVRRPDAPISTRASFFVEDGVPGAQG